MLVWLVFDSSHDLGFGHISRLVALGQFLDSKDIEYCFHVEESIPKRVIDFIQRNKLNIRCTCSGWPKLIVTDTYNTETIGKLSLLAGAPILAFTDELTPTFGADAIIEVSPISASKSYPSGIPVLKFQDSPLLRDEIVSYGEVVRKLDVERKKWLVTLGGVDDLVYRNFLEQLKVTLDHQELNITVASGSSAVGTLANSLGFKWLNHALDVSAICDNFDVAVTGAGVTAWELAYLRLPGFVIGVVGNQDFQLDYLIKHKIRLGARLAEQEFQSNLRVLVAMNHKYSEIIRPIDGRSRVYEFMESLL